MDAAWHDLTSNSNWFEMLPDIELMYVPFEKQKFSNYQTSLGNHRVIFFKTKSHNGFDFIVSPQLKNNVRKYWYASDRVSVLQKHRKVCIKHQRNIFQEHCKFEMGNHASAFRSRKLPSNPISFQTLNTSSSSTYTHQLASLLEMMFLNMRTGDWNTKVEKNIKLRDSSARNNGWSRITDRQILICIQFHWHLETTNFRFWLVNILLRKLDTSSKKNNDKNKFYDEKQKNAKKVWSKR